MNVQTFLKRVNYALRGTDDDVPTATDDDGKYWIETFNRKKDEMYDDTTKNWRSAFDDDTDGKAKITGGTIAAAARPSFNLPESFLAPAESAIVVDTDGQYHYFDVVEPAEADRRVQSVYISGQNPQKLKFSAEIEADSVLVGGTLYLPGYYRPDDLDPEDPAFDEETAIIPVDDANWGVMATAAQVAFNDITYEEKFDDLEGQAGILWKNMVKANRKRGRKNPKTTPYAVKRIRGVR